MHVLIIIPFRLESQRFPGKALAEFAGNPLIVRSLNIATEILQGIGSSAEVVLTGPKVDFATVSETLPTDKSFRYIPSDLKCRSATDRVIEISRHETADLYLSVPLDEALLRPDEVIRVLTGFISGERPVDRVEALTLWCPFYCRGDAESPLSAKVITDTTGRVMYLSRAPIPYSKNGKWDHIGLKKNVGVFFFPRPFLDKLVDNRSVETSLDRREGLEQLRWLELGMPLYAEPVSHIGFGIDTPSQIAELEARIGC